MTEEMEGCAVLIVEDDADLQNIWRRMLEPHIDVLQANASDQAREIFRRERGRIWVIVMDGILNPETGEDSIPLIKEFRPLFHGPIIAAAGDPSLRELMIHHGCDVNVDWKEEVPQKVLRELALD
jgi:DNA-binding NtrC family response regulator